MITMQIKIKIWGTNGKINVLNFFNDKLNFNF